VEELTQIRDRLAWDLKQAWDDLERAHTSDEGIMRSHRTRGHGLRLAGERIAALLTHVEESTPPAPPARPLDVVLADIKAAGHVNIDLTTYSGGLWTLRTDNDSELFPIREEKPEEREARRWRTERGEAYGETAVEAAEKRLAGIRSLRAERIEQANHLSVLVNGLMPGWRATKTDDGDWLVLRPHGGLEGRYDTEDEARSVAEAHNRRAILASIAGLPSPEPRYEPVGLGASDAAEADQYGIWDNATHGMLMDRAPFADRAAAQAASDRLNAQDRARRREEGR
jgi:hypothetical protein